MCASLNQDTVTVINLVLYNLRLEAVQGAGMFLHPQILPGYPDASVPFGLPGSFQGQAAFLGFILPEAAEDLRVHHGHDHGASREDDNPLSFADHIRGHSDTAVQVGTKGIGKVLRDRDVLRGSILKRIRRYDKDSEIYKYIIG